MNMLEEIYRLLLHKHLYSVSMLITSIIFFLVRFFFKYFSFSIFDEYLDVHAVSFSFIALITLTYFSWSNYYYSQKCDPGFIPNNREHQNRVCPIGFVVKDFFKDVFV